MPVLVQESRKRFEVRFGFFPEGEVGAVGENFDPAVGQGLVDQAGAGGG